MKTANLLRSEKEVSAADVGSERKLFLEFEASLVTK